MILYPKRNTIAMTFYVLLLLLPIGLGLLYALGYSLGLIGALSDGFTADHWIKVLTGGEFLGALGCSAGVALISLSVALVLALVVVIKWTQHKPDQAPAILYVPLSIPPIIAAFIGFQVMSNSGLLSRWAFQAGWITDQAEFGPLVNDPYYIGVILTQVMMTFPYLALLFTNIYQQENMVLLRQLSVTLGSSEQQIQTKVIIPVLLQKARTNLILCAVFLMSAYEIPLLLGTQSPLMMSVLMGQKFKKFNLADIPQAYVMTVLYAFLMIGLIALTLRKPKRRA